MAALLNLILSHPYATLMLLAAICAVIRFVPAAGGSSTPAFAGYSSDDSCGDQDSAQHSAETLTRGYS